MQKWADYLISAVRYEESINKKTVSYCKVHPDNGDTVGPGTTWSKEEIMDAIFKGVTFFTISKDNRGKWKKGRKVTFIKTEKVYLNDDFVKVDADNLVSVSEF